jgi:hypothetical protein
MAEFLPLETRTGKVRGTSSLVGTEPKPIDFSEVFVIGLGGGSTGSGITASGITPLVSGQTYIDVVFGTAQSDANWILAECQVVNTADSSPFNIWPGIITSKTAAGFRLQLNGMPDSSHYSLHWAITAGPPPPAATTYTLSGPSAGTVGAASSNFTVALPAGTTVAAPVTVTPHATGGGTFTPASVSLTTGAPSATFTYTPASAGTKAISVTNSGGLTDPTGISFVASSFATAYSLSGPSSGRISVASTNFTVALIGGGGVASPVTVTPSAGGGGGTFTPTSVTLSTGTPSATFTYTPASYGAKTISVTNSGSLTNPANLTYTSVAAIYALTGPSSGTVSVASTNFMVALPPGAVVIGTVTVTPSDGGGGGTFTPTTVGLTTAAPSATFTYTPASTGAKTISVTNSGGLTDPANLTYTVGTGGLADGDTVTVWHSSSILVPTNHGTAVGTPIYKTNIINGKPVVRFSVANAAGFNLAIPPSGGSAWYCFAVMKQASNATSMGSLVGNAAPGLPLCAFLIDTSTGLYIANRGGYGVFAIPSIAFHILVTAATGDALGNVSLRTDGVNVTIGSTIASASSGNFGYLGYNGNGTPTYGEGDIAEVLFYNLALTGTDVQNIEKYLGTKYGISVPAGSVIDPNSLSGLTGWWKADAI